MAEMSKETIESKFECASCGNASDQHKDFMTDMRYCYGVTKAGKHKFGFYCLVCYPHHDF